eukprot:m.40559 g.40559  ORF g.40559 m.40559 type:complete len:222 (-) comp5998_c0_seq1:32-697(-)
MTLMYHHTLTRTRVTQTRSSCMVKQTFMALTTTLLITSCHATPNCFTNMDAEDCRQVCDLSGGNNGNSVSYQFSRHHLTGETKCECGNGDIYCHTQGSSQYYIIWVVGAAIGFCVLCVAVCVACYTHQQRRKREAKMAAEQQSRTSQIYASQQEPVPGMYPPPPQPGMNQVYPGMAPYPQATVAGSVNSDMPVLPPAYDDVASDAGYSAPPLPPKTHESAI